MPARETPLQRGKRAARAQRRRIGEELRRGRLAVGLSLREVGRLVGMSHSAIARRERGEVEGFAIDQAVVIGTVLGLDVRVLVYPTGAPVRDASHLALLARFRQRVSTRVRFRTEVPMPIPGDLRGADAVIDRFPTGSAAAGRSAAVGRSAVCIVEAETRVDDVQALVRRVRIKQRDMGADHVILLLSDTRHHRALVHDHPDLLKEFPITVRASLRSLGEGRDPGGDAIVLL